MHAVVGLEDLLASTTPPLPLRGAQTAALHAVADVWAYRRRTWLVLPPGAGKTLVGLEAARRLGRPIVAFGPNTAVQGQWIAAWNSFTPPAVRADADRDLRSGVTALTYQALATFDPDDRAAPETDRARVLDRLHSSGRALVRSLRALGPVTILLDEATHLGEVWGRLLADVLDLLPDAYVLGLTATPPATMTSEQAVLVTTVFGPPAYVTSIPAAVREGQLPPFAELAWLVTPTAGEEEWLAAEAARFTQFCTDVLDPAVASVPFLGWLRHRFVDRADPGSTSWAGLERDEPELAAAALRFAVAGLLPQPVEARIREEHRHPPTMEDWVLLLGDWVTRALGDSSDPRDVEARARVRATLPSIGYRLTEDGVREGPSPVGRIVAHSEAKVQAATEILTAEAANLGPRLKALLLADQERVTVLPPARLAGVLDPQAGSAGLLLARLAADPRTAELAPMLVTGRTVAAGADTARAFVSWARTASPGIDLDSVDADASGVVAVTGRWTPRTWVRLATRYFEDGNCRALLGTRALLGEGWDAPGITTLVDLTTATSPTAVVQTRGRALRADPRRPEKVALTWSVVCVTESHPHGTADWERFVRKYTGFFGVDDTGAVVDGVGHVDAAFSPYAPPPVVDFPRLNARMLERAADRDAVRASWRVGAPYAGELRHVLRVTPRSRHSALGAPPVGPPRPPEDLPAARGIATRARPRAAGGFGLVLAASSGAAFAFGLVAAGAAALGLAAVVLALVSYRVGARLSAASRRPADLAAFAYAVADALQEAGLSPVGAEAVRIDVAEDGALRVRLDAGEEASGRFATALDEVLTPLAFPKYVMGRYVLTRRPRRRLRDTLAGAAWLCGLARRNAFSYSAVPTVFGANREQAEIFARAWSRWLSPAVPVFTGSAAGQDVLAACRGIDLLEIRTALRIHWT